ncbi:MAG: PTS sugar transporter subunit IIB [Erysipelotrichaceae bacterium]|nr:PTS sugar transporter subunit IIB [Erysipelotrichaceae bacterium]
MLRILLCCGGGFSSSAIVVRMQNEIKDRGLEDQYSIDFYPLEVAGLNYAKEKFVDYDVIICCPHLKMVVRRMMESDVEYDKPIYILPPKMYGMMKLDEIIADCEDVVEMYNKDHKNPVCFPGEENIMKVKRGVAYRHQ